MNKYRFNLNNAQKLREEKTLQLLRKMVDENQGITPFDNIEKGKIKEAKNLTFPDKKLVNKVNQFIKENKIEFMSFQKLSAINSNHKIEDTIQSNDAKKAQEYTLYSIYADRVFQSSADRRSGISNYWLHNVLYDDKKLWESDVHSSSVLVPYQSKMGKKSIIAQTQNNAREIYQQDDNNAPQLMLYQTLLKPGIAGFVTGKENQMLHYKHKAIDNFKNVLKGVTVLSTNHSINMSLLCKLNNYLCNNFFFGVSLWQRREVVKRLQQLNETEQPDNKLVADALAQYKKAMNTTYPNRRDMLSRAAYELIAVNHLGGKTHTTCKSGKDRAGMVKLFADALLVCYQEKKRFPNLYSKRDQKHFAEIFKKLFYSEHMQQIADINSPGAYGLKSMQAVLPKFLYDKLKNHNPQRFSFFKQAAKLNNQLCQFKLGAQM
ncbi:MULTISPECIES: hypothetical protein [Cysteiniphilum]|uniref:Uncharacterized protein n=1 Tax=Cysteiniphilum litorale TaxID=2056700 RepID=A0A8J3E898_9GAMM|nr:MULTISPECIES: hypothetical protein [Cysteiniphilum]GGF93421.1 hypothetical protein GCM10010995_08220 [Cysteiniphilum litorale]